MDELLKIALPISTFFLGAWLNAVRVASSENIEQLNEIIDEIKSIELLAVDYWSDSRNDESPRAEVMIKGGMFLLSKLMSATDGLYGDLDFLSMRCLDDFVDAVTGGTFETISRNADLGRAMDVRRAAAELVVVTRRRRFELSSPAAVGARVRDIWQGIFPRH